MHTNVISKKELWLRFWFAESLVKLVFVSYKTSQLCHFCRQSPVLWVQDQDFGIYVCLEHLYKALHKTGSFLRSYGLIIKCKHKPFVLLIQPVYHRLSLKLCEKCQEQICRWDSKEMLMTIKLLQWKRWIHWLNLILGYMSRLGLSYIGSRKICWIWI